MNWPVRPTCHDAEYRATSPYPRAAWRVQGNARSCGYCGSIHPEDLLAYLAAGGLLGGADWKYSWPHKFYLDGPNRPRNSDDGPLKWYNNHLNDDGYDEESRTALLAALTEHSGIAWAWDAEKGVSYSAVRGYQRMNFQLPDGSWTTDYAAYHNAAREQRGW